MNIETIFNWCIELPDTYVGSPFGPDTLVFRVSTGKIFAMMGVDHDPVRLNLKCDPERAIELRETHSAIIPGYHSNKKHWNTLVLDGTLDPRLVKELIEHSYSLVVPKRKRS
jgi:predicted DNA-binding protein (MmcQ/YjbR family)